MNPVCVAKYFAPQTDALRHPACLAVALCVGGSFRGTHLNIKNRALARHSLTAGVALAKSGWATAGQESRIEHREIKNVIFLLNIFKKFGIIPTVGGKPPAACGTAATGCELRGDG